MLKKFFISMLGTMAGFWISLILFFVVGAVAVGVAIGSAAGDSAVKVENKSILHFNLSGEVAERYSSQPFLQMIQNFDKESLTLDEMLRSLRKAADDDRIKALYIECGGAYMAPASREEVLEALAEFKESGKPVIAYGDAYTQGDYMIAAMADSLYLNPMGAIDIHGVGGASPFFTGLLDKLGVKMQIVKVGTYKSAVEPFILTSMSEPARLQMKQYCDSIWAAVAGSIASARSMPVDSIYSIAPKFTATWPATEFVNGGFATSLKYNREVDATLRRVSGLKDKDDVRLISPADYLASPELPGLDGDKDHIAVYYAVGDIVDEGDDGIVGSAVTKDIVELADDEHVKGLVLRVNSPGGSAFASEQIWESLEYFKSKGKPFYVSMGDYAASGGYYISCGADSIFADRSTITGSIGVFGMIPDMSGLVTGKLGISFSTVETNPNAAGISIMQPMTAQQHAALQRSVEDMYDRFTGRVAEGRHMPQDSVKAIAEGRVWIGGRALQLGLVDRLGSLDATVKAMADRLDMNSSHVKAYPSHEEEIWEQILKNADFAVDSRLASELDAETLHALGVVKRLRSMNPVQARMEAVEFR